MCCSGIGDCPCQNVICDRHSMFHVFAKFAFGPAHLLFEPTSPSCMVGSYASLSVCLFVLFFSFLGSYHFLPGEGLGGGPECAAENGPSDPSICLSVLVICRNLRVSSMSTSSCIFNYATAYLHHCRNHKHLCR